MFNEDVNDIWRQVIERYTTLQFIRMSDRLPALSGLASNLAQTNQSRYLADLWENELLWEQIHATTQILCFRDKDLKIPSWSWASILKSHSDANTLYWAKPMRILPYYEIGFHCQDWQDSRLKILSSSCNLVGNNPFEEVSGAVICILGAVIKTKLCMQRGSETDGYQVVCQRKSSSTAASASSVVHLDILGPTNWSRFQMGNQSTVS